MIGRAVPEDVPDRLLGYLASCVQQPGPSSHRASAEHLSRTFGLRRKGRCVIHDVLTSLDPNPDAVHYNSGEIEETRDCLLMRESQSYTTLSND